LPTLIQCSAWDEIHDVFGDGHEYDWALEADDEIQYDEDNLKPEMKYQDVSFFLVWSLLGKHPNRSSIGI
jgi:hypothetical protein